MAAKLQPGNKEVRKAYNSVKAKKKKWRSRSLAFAKGPGCGPALFSLRKSTAAETRNVTALELHQAVWGAVCGVRSSTHGGDSDGDAVIESALALSKRYGISLSVLRKPEDTVERMLPPALPTTNGPAAVTVEGLKPNDTLALHWSPAAWIAAHGPETAAAASETSTTDNAVAAERTMAESSSSYEMLLPGAAAAGASQGGEGGLESALEEEGGCFDLRKVWSSEVQEHESFVATKAQAQDSGSDVVTLYDCLRLFFSRTPLTGNEQAYCSRCKTHQDAERQLHITNAPRYICVDLKRFRHDGQNADMMQRMMGGMKINTLIDFPLDGLDFSEFVADECDAPVRRHRGLFFARCYRPRPRRRRLLWILPFLVIPATASHHIIVAGMRDVVR